METKSYKELDLTSNFMFCKIMYSNPDVCRQLLEMILKKKVSRIEYSAAEKAIEITADARGIRMDVYLEDPFDRKSSIYTFENRSVEYPDLAMGDDAFKVFLNASGDKSGIPEELAEFLNYLSGESPKDMFTKRLDDLLRQAREHKKWEVEYMTLEMQYREKYKEGLADGEERLGKLMSILAEKGLIEEMKKATEDKEYREILFKKYNL